MQKKDDKDNAPKYFHSKGAVIRNKFADVLNKGSLQSVIVRKGERTIIKVPLTVGIGSATAAILINAPLTAVVTLVAMSNDINIKLQSEKKSKDP